MYKKSISSLINEAESSLSTNTCRQSSSWSSSFKMQKDSIFYLAFLMTLGALVLNQAQALSLISEKCDPNKVGPDETTVKGGWQAEIFNGLSFRTCGKFANSKGLSLPAICPEHPNTAHT